MDFYYILTEQRIYTEDFCDIPTYGIAAKSRCSDEILSEFPDVSTNRNFVIRLIEILNSNAVELCHFYDVVTDELNR